jgi:long-chain-fatty-acid---luciferin-component ligase
MNAKQDDKDKARRLAERLANYIPPRDTWTPADEPLYKPVDLYRVPVEEAREMQQKAIKFTFINHYNNNYFYHKYCEMRDVRPDDIKTIDDLDKIPLIPDVTFKQYPSGKDFARWLATVFTGELPKIVIKGANPTYDDVINAFNAAGLVVAYSSGTSGRLTIIPRDRKTFIASQFAAIKLSASMATIVADHDLFLFPNPTKTNLFAGKISTAYPQLYEDVQYALDYVITAEVTQKAMSENKELKGKATSSAQRMMQQTIIDTTIQWLERYDNTKESIRLNGPPFMLFHVMNALEGDGKYFDFGERGMVMTGGGWKIQENIRISHVDFRKLMQDVLGIPEANCIDGYSMCESNGAMIQCPEGHFLHAPYTFYRPLVLDDDLLPTGFYEWGRFAFLDATAQSYPGFIISGDRARMLEHCPVCDRPGPVFEPEVQRASGEEVRGCAEVIQNVLVEEGKKNSR